MEKEIRFAFVKTLPIIISYFFISCAYGLFMHNNGYSVIWSLLCSIFIYTGAFQMVLASFLVTNTQAITVILTCILMSIRQVFYGLSYIDDFKKSGKKLPFMIHTLTDETYALLNSIDKYPNELNKANIQFYIQLFSQLSWVLGTIVGSLIGIKFLNNIKGVDFALVAMFITIVVDQFKDTKDKRPLLIALICSSLFLIIFKNESFLLPSLIVTIILLTYLTKKELQS